MRGEVTLQKQEVYVGERGTGVMLTCLRVNGKPLSLEYYETIPEEPLGGEPLGWVNLHNDACDALGEHCHLLWLNADSELRTTTVSDDARWDDSSQIFVDV